MKNFELYITFCGDEVAINNLHKIVAQCVGERVKYILNTLSSESFKCNDILRYVSDVENGEKGYSFEVLVQAFDDMHIDYWKQVVEVQPIKIFFVGYDEVNRIFKTNDAAHEVYAYDYFVDCKIDDLIKAELYDMESGPYSKQELAKELVDIYGYDDFDTLMNQVKKTDEEYLDEDDYLIIVPFEIVE